MAVDQDRNQIYGGSFYAGTVSIIDGADNRVINRATLADHPPTLGIDVYPLTRLVYAVNIDVGTVGTVAVFREPPST